MNSRAFFLLSFGLVFTLSVYFISNVYEKWSATPIIVTVSPVAISIEDIPFPAVTICNMNQARRSIVNKYPNDSTLTSYLHYICELDNSGRDSSETLSPVNNTNSWTSFRDFLINVSQPCSEMLVECRYARQSYSCMTLFDSILTDEGICCVFNAVDPRFLYQNYR